MTDSLVRNQEPLDCSFLPTDLVNRADEKEALQFVLPDETGESLQNLHIQGPRGTGKTTLARRALADLPDRVQRYYVSCTEFDTQYKVLKVLHEMLTGEASQDGYHVSDFQRAIEDRLGAVPTVLVLDELDFLLANDGDDLLYFLSRLDDSESIGILLISTHKTELESALEDRTFSSLYPQRVSLEPYEAEHVYRILADRAENALRTRSIHREALTYMAASVSNTAFGLHWLRQAVREAESVVSEEVVKDCYDVAYDGYVDSLLDDFSTHHQLLYRVIADRATDGSITTGTVYEGYQERCDTASFDPLSNRRLSDFITHLELLDLIQVDYHYGGRQGRTREIRLHRAV